MKPESKTTVNHPLGRGAANSLASSKGKVSYDEVINKVHLNQDMYWLHIYTDTGEPVDEIAASHSSSQWPRQ